MVVSKYFEGATFSDEMKEFLLSDMQAVRLDGTGGRFGTVIKMGQSGLSPKAALDEGLCVLAFVASYADGGVLDSLCKPLENRSGYVVYDPRDLSVVYAAGSTYDIEKICPGLDGLGYRQLRDDLVASGKKSLAKLIADLNGEYSERNLLEVAQKGLYRPYEDEYLERELVTNVLRGYDLAYPGSDYTREVETVIQEADMVDAAIYGQEAISEKLAERIVANGPTSAMATEILQRRQWNAYVVANRERVESELSLPRSLLEALKQLEEDGAKTVSLLVKGPETTEDLKGVSIEDLARSLSVHNPTWFDFIVFDDETLKRLGTPQGEGNYPRYGIPVENVVEVSYGGKVQWTPERESAKPHQMGVPEPTRPKTPTPQEDKDLPIPGQSRSSMAASRKR